MIPSCNVYVGGDAARVDPVDASTGRRERTEVLQRDLERCPSTHFLLDCQQCGWQVRQPIRFGLEQAVMLADQHLERDHWRDLHSGRVQYDPDRWSVRERVRVIR